MQAAAVPPPTYATPAPLPAGYDDPARRFMPPYAYGSPWPPMVPAAPPPPWSTAGNVHSTLGAVAHLTDIVAANADALSHLALSVTGLLERLGVAAAEALAWVRGEPPRDASGAPVMDAAVFAAVRRQKLLRWAAGAAALLAIAFAARQGRSWWKSGAATAQAGTDALSHSSLSAWQQLVRLAISVGKIVALLLGVRAGIEFAKRQQQRI